MTILKSDWSSSHRPTLAEYRKRAYVSNGWNRMVRWDGRSGSMTLAGIEGPSQEEDSWTPSPTTASGICSVGVHVFRYRYLDSQTGYVSNPSEEREIEVVSGAEQLTFPINTTGAANIIRSTDAKADKIVIEMTVVGGSDFFKALEVLNSASSAVVNISDADLEVQLLPWPSRGHDLPPVAKHVLTHRERTWLFGQVEHSTGTASFTNGSNLVPEGSTDPDWSTEALGATSVGGSAVWFIQKEGDSEIYEIDYFDSANSRLVLVENYTGTTEADASYKIFSRTNVLWVSNPNYPEGFTPLKFLEGPQSEMSGDIVACLGYGPSLLIFGQNSMFKLSWDLGPDVDPLLIPLSKQYGALNQWVVIEVEGSVYSMDRLGWSRWGGTIPQWISRPVDAIRDEIDYNEADKFHAAWFPESRCVRWFVCFTGETYPQHYVQLDVDTGAWSTGEYRQGIASSRLVPSAEGPRPYLGDSNGHVWDADQGPCDGCDPAYSHLTSIAGSNASTINTSETLPTTDGGLAGCYVHWLEGGEGRLIQSNTSSSLTLATSFTSAPTPGDTLWVGGIPGRLKTRAFRARRPASKHRPRHLHIEFKPTSSVRYLRVRAYDNRSSTPKAWSLGGNDLAGVVWPGNNPDYATTEWLIDLSNSDGYSRIPLGMEFRRYLEIELLTEEPDSDFEVLGLEVDLGERGDEHD